MNAKISDESQFKLSLPIRAIRLAIYGFGFVTFFWFFWCFIGLIIGVIFFIKMKDPAWKRNGIILASAIGFITLLIHFYKGLPPLNLIIATGIPLIFSFFIILLIWHILNKKNPNKTKKIKSWYYEKIRDFSTKKQTILKFTAVLVPILLWSVVSIDFGVMFDNNARLLWIHAPSTTYNGTSFEITVEAWDPYERLSATYTGKVSFSLKSYNISTYNAISNPDADLPSSYTFTGQTLGSDIAYEIRDGKDNGKHVFDMTIDTIGIHYILVSDSLTSNTYYSNPILVYNSSESRKMIYWGDIHTHSALSDASGDPTHSYFYARYIACLDYYALTDHGEIMLFNPGAVEYLESTTNGAYEPHKFTTFNGMEWTNVATGHYTCIFSGDENIKSPILSYLTLPTTDDLWNTLDTFTSEYGVQALALPHHTTKKSYIEDWTYINPKYVKIAETTSVHGDCLFEQRHPLNYRGELDAPPEYTNGSSIMDAFIMGKRMTLYASSDEHDGHPGHSLSHTRAYVGHQRPFSTWPTRIDKPYPGGITGVHADSLTRAGVFAGLYNQRIFANSDHGRPILDFKINGTPVGDGSTFNASSESAHRELSIFLVQDGAPVAKKNTAASVTANWVPNWKADIEILKNGKLWDSITINSPIVNITMIDKDPIIGTSYEHSCVKIGENYYINRYSDNPINPSTLTTKGFDFYVIRIVAENGRMSWIGPIWAEY